MNIEIDSVYLVQIGKLSYCFGRMKSSLINELLFVPTLELNESPVLNEILTNGYQRPGKIPRMKLFKKFLDSHSEYINPPVIISSRGQWEFVPDTKDSRVGKLIAKEKAAIVDGQHRLGGFYLSYKESQKELNIDFIVVLNFTLSKEREAFDVINSTAKPVAPSIIRKNEGRESALIGQRLNEDSDSVFMGRISYVGTLSRDHLFNLATVCKNLERLLKGEEIDQLGFDEKVRIAKDYFEEISDVFAREWSDIEKLDVGISKNKFDFKMLEATGLIAWSLVGNVLLTEYFSSNSPKRDEDLRKKIKVCGNLDWSKDGAFSRATGEVGGRLIYEKMLINLARDKNE